MAARNHHDLNYDELSDGTIFPEHTDKVRPLSPVAARCFQVGVPPAFSYLPLYLEVVWDAQWAWILSFFLSGRPLYHWLRNFHHSLDYFQDRPNQDGVAELLQELRGMELRTETARTIDELSGLEGALNAIHRMSLKLSIPAGNRRDEQLLVLAIERIMTKLDTARKRMT